MRLDQRLHLTRPRRPPDLDTARIAKVPGTHIHVIQTSGNEQSEAAVNARIASSYHTLEEIDVSAHAIRHHSQT